MLCDRQAASAALQQPRNVKMWSVKKALAAGNTTAIRILVSPQMSQRSCRSCIHQPSQWSQQSQHQHHDACSPLQIQRKHLCIIFGAGFVCLVWFVLAGSVWFGLASLVLMMMMMIATLQWSNLGNLLKLAAAVKVQASYRLRCTSFYHPFCCKILFLGQIIPWEKLKSKSLLFYWFGATDVVL